MQPGNRIRPHAQLKHRPLINVVRDVEPQYPRQRRPCPPLAAAQRRDLRRELARLQLVRGDGAAWWDGARGVGDVGGDEGGRGRGVGVVDAGGEVCG